MRSIALVIALLLAVPGHRAQACSLNWVIMFDNGSESFDRRAVEKLQEFATYFPERVPLGSESRMSCGLLTATVPWTVVLIAHADDTGVADRCALSARRGHLARARLAILGIPEADMIVRAMGDRARLVPGPGNVSDAQNRRVDIIVAGPDFRFLERYAERPCP